MLLCCILYILYMHTYIHTMPYGSMSASMPSLLNVLEHSRTLPKYTRYKCCNAKHTGTRNHSTYSTISILSAHFAHHERMHGVDHGTTFLDTYCKIPISCSHVVYHVLTIAYSYAELSGATWRFIWRYLELSGASWSCLALPGAI